MRMLWKLAADERTDGEPDHSTWNETGQRISQTEALSQVGCSSRSEEARQTPTNDASLKPVRGSCSS